MKSIMLKHCLITMLIMLTVAVAIAEEQVWTGDNNTNNSISTIENPGDPIEPLRMIHCEELWRVGGDDEVADAPLGFITDIEIDREGQMYLLDSSFSCIHIFDPTGHWLRSIGRQGDGPGEFTRAEKFLILPKGDFGVLQPMSAKVIGLTRDGLPAPNVEFRGDEGIKIIGLIDAVSDQVIVDLTEQVRKGKERFMVETLATYDRKGNPQRVILERMIAQADQGVVVDADGNGSFGGFWCVSADGRIFVSRRPHEYQIEVFNLAGVLQKIIQRQYATVRLSKDELADENERVERLRRMTRGSGITFEVDPDKRDIVAMYPRPTGDLWVSTSRGDLDRVEGTLGLFDVFDINGRYVRQVSPQVDYNPERDNFELIGDRLFIFKQGQMRPSYVSESSKMTIYYDNDNLESDDQDDEAVPFEVVCYQLVD